MKKKCQFNGIVFYYKNIYIEIVNLKFFERRDTLRIIVLKIHYLIMTKNTFRTIIILLTFYDFYNCPI